MGGLGEGTYNMVLGKRPLRGRLCALLSVLCIFVVAFTLPQLFLRFAGTRVGPRSTVGIFKLGLENISPNFLRALTPRGTLSYSVALVTNHTQVDLVGARNIDILLQKGLDVKKVFVTHHDFSAGQVVYNPDPVTRIPIINLHGRHLKIDDFRGIDVIFCDVQDTGVRHSSALSILMDVMENAGRLDKTVVVLDRPNPLGDGIEGAFDASGISQSLLSAVLPIRYGMTVGELAQYCNKHMLKKSVTLYVVPMDNYNRHMCLSRSSIGALSRNIRSVESCYGYSFLGLLGEVAPFDVGVGTDKAFQCILLPEKVVFSKKQWFKLQAELRELGIESAYYRYFSHRKKQFCRGLRLSIGDIGHFSLFKALIGTLKFFKNEGVPLAFAEGFCKIPGMRKIKELIEGSMKQEELESELKGALEHFFVLASSSFIYKPYPKAVVT